MICGVYVFGTVIGPCTGEIMRFAGNEALDTAKKIEEPPTPILRVPVKGRPSEVVTEIGHTVAFGRAVAVVNGITGAQDRFVGIWPAAATGTTNDTDTDPAISVTP
jgi:hypothetical protein